jgi:hypothetical protein
MPFGRDRVIALAHDGEMGCECKIHATVPSFVAESVHAAMSDIQSDDAGAARCM